MNALELFQEKLVEKGYTCYIVPTSDYHNSEYVSDFFKAREYLSGFTGSAGTLVVFADSAYLWADSRYYIQAELQLIGSNITLMKDKLPGVPSIKDFLNEKLNDGDTLGFDGRCLTESYVKEITESLKDGVAINSKLDLPSEVWNDRPPMPFSVLYKLDTFFSGESAQSKINRVKEKMAELGANYHILTKLEDQAWLYNLRGDDVAYTPVFLSYTVITPEQTLLFIDPSKVNLEIEKYLDDIDVTVRPYTEIFDYLQSLKGKQILVDPKNASSMIYSKIIEGNTIIEEENPTLLFKAIKNETEIKNIKLAHIKDAVTMVKFQRYLKSAVASKLSISELSLAEHLDAMRKESEGCVDLSFSTICGYKEHGAICHYKVTEESNLDVEGNGLLLIDSGGHYLEGTTDITRTYAINRPSDEMKTIFTYVLKAHIALARAVFPKDTTAKQVDTVARMPLWMNKMNFGHGTGHGVGYLLSVHEGPNGFSSDKPLVPGMITTDEPGLYLENKFGVRIESELLCTKSETNTFGEFYEFENVTYVPIDLEAIKPSLLNKEEKEWLNNYHKTCLEKLEGLLDGDDKAYLEEITKSI